MAWTPKPGNFHYGRTEKDYTNLINLHEKYKLQKPPLEELKEAALADGYPPEKVANFKYVDMSNINVDKLLNPKKYAKQKKNDDEIYVKDDDDEDNVLQEEELNEDYEFDIDNFDSDNEEVDFEY